MRNIFRSKWEEVTGDRRKVVVMGFMMQTAQQTVLK